MTKLDTLLLELEKLDGKRTLGEWASCIFENVLSMHVGTSDNAKNNAAFIVAAVNSNKVLREVIKIQRGALEFVASKHDMDFTDAYKMNVARQALQAAEKVCEEKQ